MKTIYSQTRIWFRIKSANIGRWHAAARTVQSLISFFRISHKHMHDQIRTDSGHSVCVYVWLRESPYSWSLAVGKWTKQSTRQNQCIDRTYHKARAGPVASIVVFLCISVFVFLRVHTHECIYVYGGYWQSKGYSFVAWTYAFLAFRLAGISDLWETIDKQYECLLYLWILVCVCSRSPGHIHYLVKNR